jgi:hypothetical protein
MGRMYRSIAAALVVLGSGCGGPEGPDPYACSADTECLPGPMVNPDDPCCDTGVAVGLYGKRYLDWRSRYLRDRCTEHDCGPLMSPAQPMACALEGRCVQGRCVDACGGTP